MNTKTIIFPASRFINHREKNEILLKTTDFLKNWKAHGNPLQSNVCIEYEQFIIIRVDENIEPASGCSLDALNNFMIFSFLIFHQIMKKNFQKDFYCP